MAAPTVADLTTVASIAPASISSEPSASTRAFDYEALKTVRRTIQDPDFETASEITKRHVYRIALDLITAIGLGSGIKIAAFFDAEDREADVLVQLGDRRITVTCREEDQRYCVVRTLPGWSSATDWQLRPYRLDAYAAWLVSGEPA